MKLTDIREKLNRLSFKRSKSPAGKRPVLALLLGILVLLTVFLGIPFYVTSQPSFFGGYKGVERYYDAWVKSTHAEVNCVRCHVKPARNDIIRFRLKMVWEFYTKPILRPSQPFSWKKPSNEACVVCHSTSRRMSPSGDLLIPHKAHVKVLKMDCIDCHEYVVHNKSPEGKRKPRMAECLRCHNGERASNECKSCHQKKSYPANHRASNWLIVHGTKKQEINCAKCHAWVKDYCKDCHKKRPVSHAARWRAKHRFRVASNRNCATCHQDNFCIKCHGEIP